MSSDNYIASNGTEWRLYETSPPIPSSSFNWAYVADGYDGAPDSKDSRCGFAPTRETAIEAIEDFISETA